MARKPAFGYSKTNSGWKVEIPQKISPTGKRQRLFFKTRDEAKKYTAKLKSDYNDHGVQASVISPSLADEANRAAELLKPFNISLLEAARTVVDLRKAELTSTSMELALEEFLKTKSQVSESHHKAYEYMRRDLLETFSGRSLSTVTAVELLAHTEEAAQTPAAYNALVRLIRAFWRWCAKAPRNWCDGSVVDCLEQQETVHSEIGVLNAGECAALFESAVQHHPDCVCGFAIALFTGMRKAELKRLQPGDISADGITLPAVSTKTGRRRFIEMPVPLKAWLKAYPVGDSVLPSNWDKKEKAVRRLAGWKVWSELVEPHTPPENLPAWPHNALRHTHASVHVALGKPLESLTFEFGHSGGHQVLKSHYVGVMPKAEAEKIMCLQPEPE